jgi:nicotinamide-nucleotide amidase
MTAAAPSLRLTDAFPEVRDVAEQLCTAGLTIAVAESCTGGLLGATLTSVAGSSDYMRGGVIAYADAVKVALLDVDEDTLRRNGAVSEAVAVQMAEGVRRALAADIGVGITGVAGPGSSERKPAGLIFIATAGDTGSGVARLVEDRGREENRAEAVHAALRLAIEAVQRAVAGGAEIRSDA